MIPTSLNEEVLTDFHEGAVGEHLRTDKTLGQLHECNYSPRYYTDISEWCCNCSTCASHRAPLPRHVHHYSPLPPAVHFSWLWQTYRVLYQNPQQETCMYSVIVVSDYFTICIQRHRLFRIRWRSQLPGRRWMCVFFSSLPRVTPLWPRSQLLSHWSLQRFAGCLLQKNLTQPCITYNQMALWNVFNRMLLGMLATAVGEKLFEWE